MTYDPKQVVFLDCETSGLDPNRHQVWEVGLIVDGVEFRNMLSIIETRADLIALNIGGYHERHPHGRNYAKTNPGAWPSSLGPKTAPTVAKAVAQLTHGRHLVGAVPNFDAAFLTKLLTEHGYLPSWHYHLIDVEALMVGRLSLHANRMEWTNAGDEIPLPWKSRELATAVGVDSDAPEFAQHTALGDARWAKACFEAVMGQPQEVQP